MKLSERAIQLPWLPALIGLRYTPEVVPGSHGLRIGCLIGVRRDRHGLAIRLLPDIRQGFLNQMLLLAPASSRQDQVGDLLWAGDQGKVTCL